MGITLLTLTTSSRAPVAIQWESGQSLVYRPVPRGKATSVQVCEWSEGQGFQVTINRGYNAETGPLALYF
jgi:hypothetical protein